MALGRPMKPPAAGRCRQWQDNRGALRDAGCRGPWQAGGVDGAHRDPRQATCRDLGLDARSEPSAVRGTLRGDGQRRAGRAAGKACAGEIQVVLGTHAIIQESVRFKELGLVVVDEQHKFGVRQRAALRQTDQSPHYLVMTATPIPRTLTMTLFGRSRCLDAFGTSPKGRQPVNTYLVTPERRGAVVAVCPRSAARGSPGVCRGAVWSTSRRQSPPPAFAEAVRAVDQRRARSLSHRFAPRPNVVGREATGDGGLSRRRDAGAREHVGHRGWVLMFRMRR